MTIGRLSIAITLLRLTVERIHTWILYAVMVLSTAVGIVFLFVSIFQCQPVSYYWNLLWMEGHCLDMDARLGIVYMYSGVAATCDFTMGILPVFLIWRLQMDRRTKVAVAGILGIACMFVLAPSPSVMLFLILSIFSTELALQLLCASLFSVRQRVQTFSVSNVSYLLGLPHTLIVGRRNNTNIHLVQHRSELGHHRWQPCDRPTDHPHVVQDDYGHSQPA